MDIPHLTTERLLLREVLPSDAADVLVFRGDPLVQKYDDPPIHTLAEAYSFIAEMRQACAADQQGMWAIVYQQRVIGLVSLQFQQGDHYHQRAELGYGIAHACWGQGFGREAVCAILGYGFGELRLNRIYARTIADNHGSVRMLERLGFVREGTQRQHSLEDDGLFHDSAIYGLLASEWERQ